MSKTENHQEAQPNSRSSSNGHSTAPNGSGELEMDFKNGPSAASVEPKGPPQACLFVASLSPATTAETLRGFFGTFGELLKVKLLKDRSARPYAFIQFKDVEVATKALQETNGKELEGRQLRVEKARVNRTLFIAKLERSMSSTQVKEIIEAEFGPVEEVTIIKNHHTNKSKGCGFVKFIYREDAMNAFVALRNNPRGWIVEWATSNNDPEAVGVDKSHIFVGGLNPSLATKELLEEKFGAFGQIESVTLINREADSPEPQEQGSPRSAFAFIHYHDPESSSKAINQENGTEWLERKIRVQYCESQEMKNKRKAYKYWNTPLPYDNNGYFRGIPNPSPLFVVSPAMYSNMSGGSRAYARKGEVQTPTLQPYMGYPYNPVIYGNQGWMFPQMQQVPQEGQEGFESTANEHQPPQHMLGDIPNQYQYQPGSGAPTNDAQLQRLSMTNGVNELPASVARMQISQATAGW